MSDNTYAISVIVPAYNAEQTLRRCLDSILAQTLPPNEIIVVDDGSADNTKQVAMSYGDQVKYIRQGNAGAAAARNTGIRAARSPWIAFLDADDEWLANKLQMQVNLLSRNPMLRWTAGPMLINNQKWTISARQTEQLLLGADYFENYFKALCIGSWSYCQVLLVERALLFEAGLFRESQKNNHDLDLYLKIGRVAPRIGFSRQPLAKYHLAQSDNISSRPFAQRMSHIIPMYQRHLRALQDQPEFYTYFQTFVTIRVLHHLAESLRHGNFPVFRKLLNTFGDLLPRPVKLLAYGISLLPGNELLHYNIIVPYFRKIRIFSVYSIIRSLLLRYPHQVEHNLLNHDL